jgi:hypothetical protein
MTYRNILLVKGSTIIAVRRTDQATIDWYLDNGFKPLTNTNNQPTTKD